MSKVKSQMSNEEPKPGYWIKGKDGKLIPGDEATKLRYPEFVKKEIKPASKPVKSSGSDDPGA